MDNDKFLKKFKGRTEQVGKEGIIGIMNNLRMNIVGNKEKPKKHLSVRIKRKQYPDNDYSYVSSIVKEEFNKNINFVPQIKNYSLLLKIPNSDENINANNNRYGKANLKINSNVLKNNCYKINKSMENPIKLFKFTEQNKTRDKGINIDNKNINNNKKIQLPLIISQKKEPENNIMNKKKPLTKNYSYEKSHMFGPILRSNSNMLKGNSYRNIQKIIINNDLNNKRKNNFSQENMNNEIRKQEFINSNNLSSGNLINKDNNKNEIDIAKTYNKILNKLNNNYLLLDSIKNKINKIQKNNSILDINNNSEHKNINKNNHINDNNHNNNIIYNNNLNKSYNINLKDTNISNRIINNNELFFKGKNGKRSFTSSDSKPKLLGLNNKLDVINEEKDDDKSTINVINNDNKMLMRKQNFLEILMHQRYMYQNKLPDNSRFKLNSNF